MLQRLLLACGLTLAANVHAAALQRRDWPYDVVYGNDGQLEAPTTCSEDFDIVCETSDASPLIDDCLEIVNRNRYTRSGCGQPYGSGCRTDGEWNTCATDICQDGRSDGRDTCLPETQKPCERLYQTYLLGNCSDGTYVGGYITVNDANGKGDYLNFQFTNTGATDGCWPLDLCPPS